MRVVSECLSFIVLFNVHFKEISPAPEFIEKTFKEITDTQKSIKLKERELRAAKDQQNLQQQQLTAILLGKEYILETAESKVLLRGKEALSSRPSLNKEFWKEKLQEEHLEESFQRMEELKYAAEYFTKKLVLEVTPL